MLGLLFAQAYVRDRERGVEAHYVLGEGHEVYREHVVAGSDPSCDIVIDHPAVPARGAEFFPAGHHFFSRALPDGVESRANQAVSMGPFEVWAGVGSKVDPWPQAWPTLPVRLGRRVAEAYWLGDDDPRIAEVRRLVTARATQHAIDDAWCKEQVQRFWSALIPATTPRRSLAPGPLTYVSTEAEALACYLRAWCAVDARPFDRGAFAHVHRLDVWVGELVAARTRECATAAVLASAIDTSGLRPALALAVHEIAALHIATLGDEVSPARPLAALVERGVVPLALPRGELALCCVTAPRWTATRHGTPADDVGTFSVERFDRAPLVLREDRHVDARCTHRTPRGIAGKPPTATLEIEGRQHPLETASTFRLEAQQLVLRPATGDDAMFVRHADGSLWLHGGDLPGVSLNGRSISGTDAMPLYDGDVIQIEPHFYMLDIKLTAIVRDPERC